MSDLIEGFEADFDALERNIKCLGIRTQKLGSVYQALTIARIELIDAIAKHCGHDV